MKAREKRIVMEIVVDAYDEEECRVGWYCYLENTLNFPFTAKIVGGEEAAVIGMPPEEECEEEMFVAVKWDCDSISEPLYGMEAPEADEQTRQAVEDWNYWVDRGYEF